MAFLIKKKLVQQDIDQYQSTFISISQVIQISPGPYRLGDKHFTPEGVGTNIFALEGENKHFFY